MAINPNGIGIHTIWLQWYVIRVYSGGVAVEDFLYFVWMPFGTLLANLGSLKCGSLVLMLMHWPHIILKCCLPLAGAG